MITTAFCAQMEEVFLSIIKKYKVKTYIFFYLGNMNTCFSCKNSTDCWFCDPNNSNSYLLFNHTGCSIT